MMITVEDYLAFAGGAIGTHGILVYARKQRCGKTRRAGASSSSSTAHGKTGGKPDYHKIARLEIEFFGQTQLCDGSPIPAGRTNVYGISDDGHTEEGYCNVNAAIGPTCYKTGHYVKRRKEQPRAPKPNMYEAVSSLYKAALGTDITAKPPPNIDPYADWTDEDGRPW